MPVSHLGYHGADWLNGAIGLLADGRIDDLKVEPLAKRLGVTKGSFYWHFDDRRALLTAVLAYWADNDTEQVIARIGEHGSVDQDPDDPGGDDLDRAGSPADALRRLVDLTIGRRTGFDGVEAAIREWAAADPEAAAVSRAVDERRLAYVAGLIEAAGVGPDEARNRAHLLYRVVIGEYTWRRYDGPSLDVGSVHRLIDHLVEPER